MINTESLSKLHQKVKYCLRLFPETRNSDIELFARLCENFFPPFQMPLYNWRDVAYTLHQVPSLDHIARCRRKVVQESEYKEFLPTVKAIALARGYSQKQWVDYAHSHGLNDVPDFPNTEVEQ